MIFSCGENWRARVTRLSDWHSFFPLLPVTIGEVDGKDVCAWLETIERKGTRYSGRSGGFWIWEYRRLDAASHSSKE